MMERMAIVPVRKVGFVRERVKGRDCPSQKTGMWLFRGSNR